MRRLGSVFEDGWRQAGKRRNNVGGGGGLDDMGVDHGRQERM
jgi:hypothetical protein